MGIICFGDSITRGYDVPYGRGWVEICDASIEGVNFTNYGEDGCSEMCIRDRPSIFWRNMRLIL